MRKRTQGFTLIEIVIAIFILLIILALSIPSMNGLLADRRLRKSFNSFNSLVRTAQEKSVEERRAYLISWDKDQLILHPESLMEDEGEMPTAVLELRRGEAFTLKLPAALIDDPPGDWIFWPTGTCEPAVVSFKGADGSWTANYASLTVRAELSNYVAR